MKNMKFWRTALVATLVLTVMLSVTGGTIAWFTDEVTIAANVIEAGNLDVELEYSKDFQNWYTVKDKSDLFTKELWEPGHTDVVYLRISNKGNLALKYLLGMNFTETEGKNVAGETFKLSDSLQYGVVDADEKYDDRNAARNAVKDNAAKLAEYKDTGALLETGDSDTVALVVFMPEEVGNEANHQTGTAAPVINLGIKVEAFQKDYESDSFGPTYDAGSSEQYITTDDGLILWQDPVKSDDLHLYLVPAEYAKDTVNVPEGVTNIGNYAFAYNSNVKTVILPSTVRDLGRGFESSTVEKVVLNEGLTTISSRAFKSTTNLKEVVISSTVTEIADNAFQKSGIKSIVIPANVQTIGETAFGASQIETVTFMGDIDIQGFAFRGCTKLRNVYMLGDVDFVPSTLNGRNSIWFCNGESNNPNTSNITFYVMNNDVAAKVRTAMGAEAGNTTIAFDALQANSTAVDEALKAGKTTVVLGEGNYVIPDSAQGKTLTFVGNAKAVVATQDDGSYEGCDYSLQGSTVTFDGITINTDSRTYTGYARMKGTYRNCTINGTFTLYDDSVFENCTFNVTGDVYNIWTWGAPNATFINCTFNSDGKALFLYGGANTNLTVNNCVFNDKGGLTDLKAAIEIGNEYGTSYNLVVNNTTVNGYEINDKGISTGTTLWANKNSMGTDKLNVVVDGVDVY